MLTTAFVLQRVGSYPKLMAGVDVSLIGKDEARLKEIAEEGAFLSPARTRGGLLTSLAGSH